MRERTVRCHEAHDNEFLILPRSPDKLFVLLETFRKMQAGLYSFASRWRAWLDSPSFVPFVGVVTDRGERASVRQ